MIDMKQFDGYEVPQRLKDIAVSILRRFTIIGVCDGMYICNRIAVSEGIGNGCGEFYGDTVTKPEKTAAYIQAAYGCNIFPEDIPELEEILRTGKISKETAVPGIQCFIERTERELEKEQDSWRVPYLLGLKKCAEETLEELRAEAGNEEPAAEAPADLPDASITVGRVVELDYVGSDTWSRPVYRNKEGMLFVDTDPRADREPKLCTKFKNSFDAEPNMPVDFKDQYVGVRFAFRPERKTW